MWEFVLLLKVHIASALKQVFLYCRHRHGISRNSFMEFWTFRDRLNVIMVVTLS